MKLKPYMVTTKHRGVFVGLLDPADINNATLAMQEARMAIKFGTSHGVMQLADTGPTEASIISSKADIPVLHDITAVFRVTDEAWAAWQIY